MNVLIIGASSGIGREVAHVLSQEGQLKVIVDFVIAADHQADA